MNPSTYPSVHSAADIHYLTSDSVCYDATQSYSSYTDFSSGLYEDHMSSAEVSSGQHAGLGSHSDADQALFEEFLTAEVASIRPPGFCTMVPVPSPPSDSSGSASDLLHYLEPLTGCELYSYSTSSTAPQSNLSPSFEQAFPELRVSHIAPAIYPSLQSVCNLQEEFSIATTSEPSHYNRRMGSHSRSSCPYPSPSPEPSPQASSSVITSDLQAIPPYAAPLHTSLYFDYPLPEPTVACISPDLVSTSAHGGYDLEDDHLLDVSPQSSCPSHSAPRRNSPSAPYPTPSPEPCPPASSTVFASQRRNAPARTAAPVASNTWQCPHCPYVQRNRRSPDLKRHIKTHTRDEEVADWVCCGVPVLDAIELGVPARIAQERRPFDFDGVLMVGGCRKAFSRRDALKRHLQREEGKCFGDAWSLHQRGNRDSC